MHIKLLREKYAGQFHNQMIAITMQKFSFRSF